MVIFDFNNLIWMIEMHYELKEFIMTCMQMITQTMYNNLKSGWK